MNVQTIINSRVGVGLAFSLGRITPTRVGHRLAYFLADQIASRKQWGMVKAVRSNQWVIHDCRLSKEQLDQAVRDTFRHTARCIFDLYHNLQKRQAAGKQILDLQQIADILSQHRRSRKGFIGVGVHLSNFDFLAQAAFLAGLRAFVISAPDPGGGYRLQNTIRRIAGMELMPASLTAVREATRRLEAGQIVMTGIDRPTEQAKYHPRFFGKPTNLPVYHVQLAMKTGTPIYVVAAMMRPDGSYCIECSDPLIMQPHPDRETELLLNAETILGIAESYIRQAPHQWAMFYPVWPQVMGDVP